MREKSGIFSNELHLDVGQIEALTKPLIRDPRIMAAYLLGSVLTPYFRRESDVDAAILLHPGREMTSMERLELAADLSKGLGHSVDIGLLSTWNLIYTKEAIIEGRCIYCRDTGARDLFAATALSLYLQLKQERRIVEKLYTHE